MPSLTLESLKTRWMERLQLKMAVSYLLARSEDAGWECEQRAQGLTSGPSVRLTLLIRIFKVAPCWPLCPWAPPPFSLRAVEDLRGVQEGENSLELSWSRY